MQLAVRGPKKSKKGGGASKVEASKDILNIFKDGEDALIYPSDSYPPWVMKLLDETYAPDDIML